jgi:hypothetical protein
MPMICLPNAIYLRLQILRYKMLENVGYWYTVKYVKMLFIEGWNLVVNGGIVNL